MPHTPFHTRAALGAISCLTVWFAGCIFDSKYPDPKPGQTYATIVLDTLYPGNAVADSSVDLYQPLLDTTLGAERHSDNQTYWRTSARFGL